MERIVKINEYTLFTKIEGEGPPLIMLHGYWGNHSLFDSFTEKFADRFTIIRPDLPGHGKSGPPPEDYRFKRFASILVQFLDQLRIKEKLFLVGHSMGGYALLELAKTLPDRIAGLVLFHTPLFNADAESIRLRQREATLLERGKRELLLQATIPSNLAGIKTQRQQSILHLLQQLAREVTLEGALGSIRAINERENHLSHLQQAQYPILLVIGRQDHVYGAELLIPEARQLINAEHLILEHSGHLGFLEEEETVFPRVSQFLDHCQGPLSPTGVPE